MIEENKNEKKSNYIRLLVTIVYLIAGFSIKNEIPYSSFLIIVIGSAVSFVSFIVVSIYIKYNRYLRWVKYIATFVDIFIISLALYTFGEYRAFKSTAFLVYFIWIGISITRFSPIYTVYTGLLSIIFYILVTYTLIHSNSVELGTITESFISSKVSIKNLAIKLFFLSLYIFISYLTTVKILTYISKAVEHALLIDKIQSSSTQLQSLQDENSQLYIKANTDSLTGIFNRRFFDVVLLKEIDKFNRYDNELSIVLIDIDNFKKINDTYGHDIGDKVILSTVYNISVNLRESDVLARWGGEEFIIIMPHTTVEQISLKVEKLRELISTSYIQSIDGCITCSFGISQIKIGDIPSTLIKRADEALYKAKRSGKNMVIVN